MSLIGDRFGFRGPKERDTFLYLDTNRTTRERIATSDDEDASDSEDTTERLDVEKSRDVTPITVYHDVFDVPRGRE
jgi:hypothetical protein